MYYSRRNLLWIPLTVVLTLFLLLLLGNASRLLAQVESPAEEPSIQVTATGEVSVEPDQAVIRVGVETQAESASDAINQNNEQLQSLIDAPIQAGIAHEQIQTQVIQLQPVYQTPTEGQPQVDQPPGQVGDKIVGYRAINIVAFRTQELDRLGELLDSAIQAGGNRIEGIHFSVSDPASYLDQAREAAWTEAHRRAEQIATLAGAELGRAIMVMESGTNLPVYAESADALATPAVPVSPGTERIQATLHVTWQLRYPAQD